MHDRPFPRIIVCSFWKPQAASQATIEIEKLTDGHCAHNCLPMACPPWHIRTFQLLLRPSFLLFVSFFAHKLDEESTRNALCLDGFTKSCGKRTKKKFLCDNHHAVHAEISCHPTPQDDHVGGGAQNGGCYFSICGSCPTFHLMKRLNACTLRKKTSMTIFRRIIIFAR